MKEEVDSLHSKGKQFEGCGMYFNRTLYFDYNKEVIFPIANNHILENSVFCA